MPDQSDSEKAKIATVENNCRKYGEKNMSQRIGYFAAECPNCDESLAFGLATPQC